MKKALLGILVMAILLVTVPAAFAKQKPNGTPFQALWQAINTLTQRLDNHTHNGGGGQGPQGPAGPAGPKGPAGITGAGTIAFIDSDVSTTSTAAYALTTDRKVWEYTTTTWNNLGKDVPTSTNAIVQWKLNAFLDTSGYIWRWNGSAWTNINHP